MSSSGPTTTTNQSSTTSPYGKAQPLLDTGLSDALSLYKSKQLNPVTPLSSLTREGMNSQVNAARRGIVPLNQALSTFRGFSQGAGDVDSAGQLDIAKRALGPSMTEQNLANVARGDLINQSDPNYDRLRQRAMENASTEAGMQASGLGRTGSDFHQTAVARQVGDTVAGMDYQRLQDERNRQVEANSLIDQMRQAGYGIGLNAQNSASATQAANQDRRFNANAAIPGMVEATYSPYERMTDIGRAYDVNNASRAGAPGSNLSSLMQLLGLSSPYSSSTATGQTQEPSNAAGQWAGGGLGLASLLFG